MDDPVEFVDEEKPVVVVDQLDEIGAADPTYGGLHGEGKLDTLYETVVTALKEAYRDRYQHSPPASVVDLFEELAAELDIPHEEEVRTLLDIKQERTPFTSEEEELLLEALESFPQELAELRNT